MSSKIWQFFGLLIAKWMDFKEEYFWKFQAYHLQLIITSSEWNL